MKQNKKKKTAALLLSAALVVTNISFVYGAENAAANNSPTANTIINTLPAELPAATSSAEKPSAESSAAAENSAGAIRTNDSASKNEMTDTESKTEPSHETEKADKTENTAKPMDTDKADSPDSAGISGTSQSTETNQTEHNTTESNRTEENNIENNGTENAGTENSSPATSGTEKTGAENTDTEKNGTDINEAEKNGTDINGTENSAETNTDRKETDVKTPDTAEEEASRPEDAAAAEESPEEAFINKNGEEITPSSLIGIDYTNIADNYDGETNVIKQYALSDSHETNTIMESYMDENGNLIMVISQGQQAADSSAPADEDSNGPAGFFSSSPAPSVDGNFSGWEEIPVSYEYNWDNSANCWEYGNWVTDPETGEQVCYKTEQGTYDSNVRHEMQLYTDNENVYLKIKYATIYESHANGDDFNFYIDGAGAKYAVTWADGTPITGTATAAGTYVVDVRNGNSSSSGSIVDGASAYYHVTENGINNELELKIPLSALQMQNGTINPDNFNMIQFFTPNLMYNPISAAGSPTGSVPFAAAAFLCVPAGYVWLKKKNGEGKAFA